MILDRQTNVCFLSKRLIEREDGMEIAACIMAHDVDVRFLELTRDIWARDYMPIQIEVNKFVGFEYCPDYLYCDGYIGTITNQARVCAGMGIDVVHSGLILDGGNVVKTSRGIIMVDKVIRENKHLRCVKVIDSLENIFQTEVILLPWDREEIFGHADGIVREISPGKVLLTNYSRYSTRLAKQFDKILSRRFDVEILEFKVEKQHSYNWCYINYLQMGTKLFLPQLTPMRLDSRSQANDVCGLDYRQTGKTVLEDEIAVERFRSLFLDCEIIPISCPRIVKDGGALNCISWNIRI